MNFTHIPAVLKTEAQWVCWRTAVRDGKPTKVPLDPHTGVYASVADPATWDDFATAAERYRQCDEVDGVGFVFTADGPFVGVDLDDCREPETGAVADWAVEVVRRLASYTEVSPSGTGLHVLVRGEVPAGRHRSGDLELYDRNRYFTVTGDRVAGAPKRVRERTDVLAAVHQEYIGVDEAVEFDADADQRGDVRLSDAELLERAQHAANGEKFRRLWRGDTAGYPSHSEADLALCTLLAFWTGGDAARIERLFARSRLVREKWRERPDYRERTIRRAIRQCSAFYGGRDG